MKGSKVKNFSDTLPHHRYRFNLTDNEKQAILASLLGDGYMSYPNKHSTMPRMAWNMGDKKHALYKRDFFSDFDPVFKESENPGWGNEWYRVATKCCLAFVDMYLKYRIDDKYERAKAISPLLSDVGWAWYYGDDGHFDLKNKCAFLHTEGLGEDGSYIVRDSLIKFLGIDNCASVFMYLGGTPKKERYAIRLNKNGTKKFFEKISKHMASGMEYKICDL